MEIKNVGYLLDFYDHKMLLKQKYCLHDQSIKVHVFWEKITNIFYFHKGKIVGSVRQMILKQK